MRYQISKSTLWLTALLALLFFADVLYAAVQPYGLNTPVSPGIALRGLVLVVFVYSQ